MSAHALGESSAHLDLHATLPITPGATTSRVILDNVLIRVVTFTFGAGQELTEHSSPRAVICQLDDGRMRFQVEGRTHNMQSGDIIYLAPGAPHALTAQTDCRLTLTMIDTDAFEGRSDG